jgi:hypothetical protein
MFAAHNITVVLNQGAAALFGALKSPVDAANLRELISPNNF